MPVLILGSGRCGTSMLARMLNICGLYIGEKDDMGAGDCFNPKGYWEHIGLSAIREEILHHYGGSEVVPPELLSGWEDDEWLQPLALRATNIFQKLAKSGREWGWKDPSSAWIVSFWKKIIPDLKIVLCYRNPEDVVSSLEQFLSKRQVHLYQRGSDQGYLIWHSINETVLNQTSPDARVVTQYEGYFPDYYDELTRILDFVGLPRLEKCSALDKRLMAFHDPALKHHATTLEQTIKSLTVPEPIKNLYVRMVAEPACNLEKRDSDSFASAGSVRSCHYSTALEIERLNLQLIARNNQLEAILSSRTHRAASAVCDMLIWSEMATKAFADFANQDIMSLVALATHADRSGQNTGFAAR